MRDLVVRASTLSRRIFASLPWGFRVASLFQKLATHSSDVLGRVAYAEFLKAGVVGLPDVDGRPALELQEKLKGTRAADRLPVGYGSAFGAQVWRTALYHLRNPEIVEEAVSMTMSKLIMGRAKIQEGVSLRTAENFIMKVVINDAKSILRSRARHETQLPTDDEGEELDVDDPRAFQQLEKMLPSSEIQHIMRDLRKVHERAPDWVEAQLDGMTAMELAESWGVSSAYVVKWRERYLPAVKKVIYKHLQEAV